MMAGYRRVNYYELCRLCTSSEGTKMHIFREEGRRRSLPTKIQTCLPLQIQEEDSLPKIICNTCVEKLESYFEFREACLNAEAMLESYFTNLKYSDDLNQEGKVSVYVRDEVFKKKDESTSTASAASVITSSSSTTASPSGLSKTKVKISVNNPPLLTDLNTVTTVGDGSTIIPSAIQILADPEMSTRLTQYKVQMQGGIPSLVPYVEESALPINVSIPTLTPQPLKQESASDNLRSDDAIPTSCESMTIPPPPPLVAAVAIAPPNQDLLQQIDLAPKERPGVAEVLKLKNINILEQCEPVMVTNPPIGTPIAGQVPNMIPASIRIDQNQFQEFLSSNIPMNLGQVQSNQPEEVQKKSVGTATAKYLFVKSPTSTKIKKHVKKKSKEQQTNTPVMAVNGNAKKRRENKEREAKSPENVDDNMNGDECNDESQKNAQESHECPTCFKTFWRKEHLNQHKKSHSGERPFACSSCSKAFSRKEHLLRHSFSHSGQKLHKCDVCSKKFSRKDNLHKHKKTHGINGPYVCEVCGRSFVVKHYYRVHMIQHNDLPNPENVGESLKPLVITESMLNPLAYKCDHCPKSFSSKNYLETHRLRHRHNKTTTLLHQKKRDKKHSEKQSEKQKSQSTEAPQEQEELPAQEQSSSELNINSNTELAMAQTQPAIITSFPAAAGNLNLTALNTSLTTINPNTLIASNIIHSPSTNVVHIGNSSYLCTPNVTSELLEQYRRIHTTV